MMRESQTMFSVIICKLCGARAYLPYELDDDGERRRPNFAIGLRRRRWVWLDGNKPICDQCAGQIAAAVAELRPADSPDETAGHTVARASVLPRGEFPS